MSRTWERRGDLAGEHGLTDIGQFIGALVFFAVWVLDSFVFRFSTFLSDILPNYVLVPAAVLLLSFSAVMAFVSHKIIFVERRDPPVVITKAFFKYVRHPLYLSEIMLYLGLFLFSGSLFSIVVAAGIAVFLNFAATIEEEKLEAVFGSQYLEYKKRTGKWLPRIIRREDRSTRRPE